MGGRCIGGRWAGDLGACPLWPRPANSIGVSANSIALLKSNFVIVASG
jgi:hypothetical protein